VVVVLVVFVVVVFVVEVRVVVVVVVVPKHVSVVEQIIVSFSAILLARSVLVTISFPDLLRW